MERFFSLSGGIAVLLLLVGCNASTPQGEKVLREVLDAHKDLASALSGVQDAASAKTAAADLDAKYLRVIASLKKLSDSNKEKARQNIAADLTRQIQESQSQLKTEGLRLSKTRGLPVEFWKIVKMRSTDMMVESLKMLETTPGFDSTQMSKWLIDSQNLRASHGYEAVVLIELFNLPPHLSEKILDKMRRSAPGATLCYVSAGANFSVFVGPVKDFKAFLKSLDLGTVSFEDEGQRTIKIAVDCTKLGALAEHQGIPPNPQFEEMQARAKERREAMEAESQRRMQEAAEAQAEREKEAKGPDPSDPEYFEKLAERMMSPDHFVKERAINALLAAKPSEVKSAVARKTIARNFKKIAENSGFSDKSKAIKGLVIWGGKFSTPILLGMLDKSHGSEQNEVIAALGDLKDPEAADALAARLGDFFCREAAYEALKKLGGGAEEALIKVGPSDDPKICLSAIELLADAGTEKSLPFLRDAQQSRNSDVRKASKIAVRKIMTRKNKAKTPSS